MSLNRAQYLFFELHSALAFSRPASWLDKKLTVLVMLAGAVVPLLAWFLFPHFKPTVLNCMMAWLIPVGVPCIWLAFTPMPSTGFYLQSDAQFKRSVHMGFLQMVLLCFLSLLRKTTGLTFPGIRISPLRFSRGPIQIVKAAKRYKFQGTLTIRSYLLNDDNAMKVLERQLERIDGIRVARISDSSPLPWLTAWTIKQLLTLRDDEATIPSLNKKSRWIDVDSGYPQPGVEVSFI